MGLVWANLENIKLILNELWDYKRYFELKYYRGRLIHNQLHLVQKWEYTQMKNDYLFPKVVQHCHLYAPSL